MFAFSYILLDLKMPTQVQIAIVYTERGVFVYDTETHPKVRFTEHVLQKHSFDKISKLTLHTRLNRTALSVPVVQ